MPPTTPTAPPKPGAPKATGKGLGKKIGPFSLWVWLVMAGGAAAIAYIYMRNRPAGDGGGGFIETVTGNQTASPMEQAYGGGSVGNENLTGQVDPNTLAALVDQQIQPWLASAGDLRGHVYEMEDALKNYGWSLNEDKTWSPPLTAPEAVFDATLGAPGTGPQQGSATPKGVRWGGQTFTTKQGLANYLAGVQGRGRAESYRDWATKHPGAAKQLQGPAPKPKSPKKAPQRTAPRAGKPTPQKAAAKPKAQKKKQPGRAPVRGGR